jgi:CHAT domain-containing protein/tetratricopeptide (TPR) repeat protein
MYAMQLLAAGTFSAAAGDQETAKSFLEQAVVLQERLLGDQHPILALTLSHLALAYILSNQAMDAEGILNRSLAMNWDFSRVDRTLLADAPPDLFDALIERQARDQGAAIRSDTLSLAGAAYVSAGDLPRARTYTEQACDVARQAGRPDILGRELVQLGSILMGQHETDLARKTLEEALQTLRATYPDTEVVLLPGAIELAKALRLVGSPEVEPILLRTADVAERQLGMESDIAIEANQMLSQVLWSDDRQLDGMERLNRAFHGEVQRRSRRRSDDLQSPSSADWDSEAFLDYQAVIFVLPGVSMAEKWTRWGPDLFLASQLAMQNSTGSAMSVMAARLASGKPALEEVIRRREQIAADRSRIGYRLGRNLVAPPMLRGRSNDGSAALFQEKTVELERIDSQIAAEFPTYTELVRSQPVPLENVQRLLLDREALLVFQFSKTRDVGFAWVVRKGQAFVKPLVLGNEALAGKVSDLRASITADSKKGPAEFKFDIAHELYEELVKPLEQYLDGVEHLIVVADGALQSYPLAALVGDSAPATRDESSYRDMPWLVKRYAISVLPSVSSLSLLRNTRPSNASKPFIGFGDPIFTGNAGTRRGLVLDESTSIRANGDLLRGLPSLPETATELRSLAASLNANEESLFLREEATERQVKLLDLSDRRVIAFATHGAVSGELKGMAQPGLVLTPPSAPTELDDGFLTATEVAKLKLDADWVVLSACDTAAGDKPGAPGLSGLAKSFIYAGSRGLLVSHWHVDSAATANLTAETFRRWTAGEAVGRAEALRQAQLKMLKDEEHPDWARPAYWAPFVVVGDGASVQIR